MEPDGYIELRLNGASYKYKFADIEWWTKDETGITIRFEDKRTFYPWTSVFRLDVQMNSEEYCKWASENVETTRATFQEHEHLRNGAVTIVGRK